MKTAVTFQTMALRQELLNQIEKLGFTEPTEIQAKAIPLLLAQKHMHIFGQAQTGTGKTLAFGLPLMERIDGTKKLPQALIVAPTRELALQTTKSLQPFAQALNISITTIYGGSSIDEQIATLKRGIQIIVGTPGRINDHIDRKTLKLDNVQTLILDEADIMLDMGFREEIEIVLNNTPKDKEIWLFSATTKRGIKDLMASHMPDATAIRVNTKTTAAPAIEQFYTMVPSRHKLEALIRFIEYYPNFYGFIFCQTKILTAEVAEKLGQRGFLVGALHGDLSQGQRNAIVEKFKKRALTILVATDVAARGIDIPDLTHVVNYSVPEDLESYIHRIGRTGRAGKQGIAITLIGKRDLSTLKFIEKRHNITIAELPLPTLEHIAQTRLDYLKQQFDVSLEHKACESDELFLRLIELLSSYAPEDIHHIFAYYLFKTQLHDLIAQRAVEQESDQEEVSLNIGTDDGFTAQDITEYINELNPNILTTVTKMRTIKRKTFIILPSQQAHNLVTLLINKKMGNLPLRPMIVSQQGCAVQVDSERRGSGQRGGQRSGSYRGGGSRRRSNDSRSSGDRRGSYGDRDKRRAPRN